MRWIWIVDVYPFFSVEQEEEKRLEEQKKEEERKKVDEERKEQEDERKKRELAEVALQMMDQEVIKEEMAQRYQAKMGQSTAGKPVEKEAVVEEPVGKDVKIKTESVEPKETVIPDKAEPIVDKASEGTRCFSWRLIHVTHFCLEVFLVF